MNKIFIFAFNRPDLLQKQIDTFNNYLIGDYQINLILDYREETYIEEFKNICNKNNVNFYSHKSKLGKTPSQYHSDVLNWVYKNLIESDDLVMFLDHDIFVIGKFNLESRLLDYDICGLKQTREDINYLWPGFLMFKYSSISNMEIDFSPQVINGQLLDSGGGTYNLLKNSKLKIDLVDQVYPTNYLDYDLKSESVSNGFPLEIFDNYTFLHTRNASHWHNYFNVNDKNKTKVIVDIVDDFLSGSHDEEGDELLMSEYRLFCDMPTEINEHLPTLYALAKQCDSIVELGVCHGKSTRALLASGTKLRSYDVWIDGRVKALFEHAKSIGNDVEYIKQSSIKCEIDECDMIFIDSWHNYYQLKKELKLHADKAKKYIVFHDTMSCGSSDEGLDAWGNGSGIDINEVYKDLDTDTFENIGINSAIFEFLSENHHWVVKKHYKNNNGLTILERKNEKICN